MTRSGREYFTKRIVQHYVNIANHEKRITINHFLQEQIPRATIYRIIKKYEESGTIGDKFRTGRPKKLSTQQLTRLKRLTNQKTGISLRQIAPKFNVNISTIKSYGYHLSKKKTSTQMH